MTSVRVSLLAALILTATSVSAWPFSRKYPLTLIDCQCQLAGTYAAGRTIRLVAPAPPIGYTFNHWNAQPDDTSIDRVSSPTAILTMPKHAVTIRVMFAPLPPAPSR